MSQEISTKLIEIVLSVLATVITAVLVPSLTSLIKSKTNDQKMKTAIDAVSNAVNLAVDYVEQTMVTQLKKDGKWNAESQEEALKKATDIAISQLTDSAYLYLLNNHKDIEETIIKYIEANIQNKKKETLLTGEVVSE